MSSFQPPKPNKALFADEDDKFVVREDISLLATNQDELLIENLYSGVNAADIRHSTHLGIRPTVIGYDFCGRVLTSPPGSKFAKDDIVAGFTPSGLGRDSKYGSHQAYLVCPEDMAFKVPEHLPLSHAAALTVVTMTAADAIFNLFNFPLPSFRRDYTRPILIWGASTSVGVCAIQFAKASGCKNILVTASVGRHELLKSLGATHTFDYASPTVAADIDATVKDLGAGSIGHALDAVGAASPSSSALVTQCVQDPSAVLVSVILQEDQRFKMPVATTKDDWTIHPPGAPSPISIPARTAHHWNSWKALLWAVDNYDGEFKLPNVQVIKASVEKALQEVLKVETLGRGFGKVVIQHPMA